MTVADNPNKFSLAGDGVTLVFPFSNLRLIDAEDLDVSIIDNLGVSTPQVEGVDYNLAYDEDNISGTITFLISAPLATDTVFGIRNTPLEQPFDIPVNAGFDAEKIENMSDNAVVIIQDQQETLDRSIKLEEGSALSNITVPDPVDGLAIIGNATNDGFILSTNKVDEVVDNAQASAVAAAASAAAASTSESNAATSASNAATSETNAAARAQAAADSAASVNLPTITATDTGQLVQVNAAGDGYDLSGSGTAGQVWTSNGADTAGSFSTLNLDSLGDVSITSPATDEVLAFDGANWVNQAASGGAWELVSTVDLSTPVSSVSFATGIDANKTHMFIFESLSCATSGRNLEMRCLVSSVNQNMGYSQRYIQNTGSANNAGNANTSTVNLAAGIGDTVSGSLTISTANGSTERFGGSWGMVGSSNLTGNAFNVTGGFHGRVASITLDEVVFQPNSGNFNGGKIHHLRLVL